jgi:hypothetical protein
VKAQICGIDTEQYSLPAVHQKSLHKVLIYKAKAIHIIPNYFTTYCSTQTQQNLGPICYSTTMTSISV